MHNEFTAIIEKDEDWYIACCPEIPAANGRGKTEEESFKYGMFFEFKWVRN
jgi:predicted RNase H-like HicB family nuclease